MELRFWEGYENKNKAYIKAFALWLYDNVSLWIKCVLKMKKM